MEKPVSPFFELCVLLFVVLVTLIAHGSLAEPLRIGGVSLAQPDLGDWYTHPATIGASDVPLFSTKEARDAPAPVLVASAAVHASTQAPGAGRGQERIVMLGDSMIEPVQQRAAAYFDKNGHRFASVIW